MAAGLRTAASDGEHKFLLSVPLRGAFDTALDVGSFQYFGANEKGLASLQGLDFVSFFGSPTRARTWDLRINSPALYRLSYRGNEP